MKRIGLLIKLGVALAVFAGSQAVALEEQKGAVVAPPQAVDSPKAELRDGAAVARPDAGTEIRIPGLGKLGTLPKMDFGLELLYGAAETAQPQDTGPADPESGGLTFRGSVKHKF